MKWTVTWAPEAEEELTNIWLRAKDRGVVSRAADRIESELRHDADNKGMAKKGRRVLHIRPLAVSYDIIPDDRLVRIVYVVAETN